MPAGAISPVGHLSSLIASLEAVTGLMGFALATGVLYGRFSRPSAKIAFSEHAIIAPYGDINSFQFRVARVGVGRATAVEHDAGAYPVET